MRNFSKFFVRNSREVWIVDADGSNPVKLTSNERLEQFPAWDVNGAFISYVADQETVDTVTGRATIYPEIFLMRSNGTFVEQITVNLLSDSAPALTNSSTLDV